MKSPLFYSEQAIADHCVLSSDESRHCVGVMRRKQGDAVNIFCGDGLLYIGELVDPNPRAARVRITSTIAPAQSPARLHLAVAPTKNFDRYEFFVEKAVEIGIASITPLICTRSERRSSKPDRLARTIIAAMKQSGNLLRPTLQPDAIFADFILRPFHGLKCIAHCDVGNRTPFHTFASSLSDILLIIGPDGDFTPDEIASAAHNDFTAVTLGNSILRTETAAIFACALASATATDF